MTEAIFYTVFAIFAIYGVYTAAREIVLFITRLAGKNDSGSECELCRGCKGCSEDICDEAENEDEAFEIEEIPSEEEANDEEQDPFRT